MAPEGIAPAKVSKETVRADFNDPSAVIHYTRAAHFLGNGSVHRIDLIAEELPPRTIPFNVLPEFAYLQTRV